MSRSRRVKSEQEALMEIGKLEDDFCKGCKIRDRLRSEGKKSHDIQLYCMNDCRIGKRIKALGGIFEYGAIINDHFKAPDLTKEKYQELRENISDADIRKMFDISRATLTRRKKKWGFTKIREYIIPSLVLKDMTKEKLEELARDYTDKEIGDMYDVSKVTIQKRRKKWGIKKGDHFLKDRFTLNEYEYLSKKKSLLDKDISELWEISGSSLLQLKKEWGIYKPRSIDPEEVGLSREKMLELVPENTDKEIADMYGLYETTVTKYRKRLGISHTLRLPRNRIKPERLKELLDSGKSRAEIAEELKIHRSTVTDLIKYFKEKNLF